MAPASVEPTMMGLVEEQQQQQQTAGAATTASYSDNNNNNNSVVEERSVDRPRIFEGFRSLNWRVNLGLLPSPLSSSVDDLRRLTADSRRRYARLRRRLLVDSHTPKDGIDSPNPVVDNPLSQDPDSTWSRFFRNAELEKMVYQDLSRLYPEHENYFQSEGRQSMLRRILLIWCLKHPQYGYRQGMHELLAPFLYVLHVDVEHLSEVRKLYEDQFMDTFDGISYLESNLKYNFDFKKFPDSFRDESDTIENAKKGRSLDELDPEIQTIILLSDAYGAEGELGVVLSEKFMEHDAYCMFDALMSGFDGAVAMADFFYSPAGGPQPNLPPVIEASAALYHLLSLIDSSIHSHLVELGVEPQYFALRWLRVLFGREFSLGNLLIIWDEIFASDNTKLDCSSGDDEVGYKMFSSRRGAFISGVAVSMILYMRSSLLSTEYATSCLQRLLNFPENVDITKLIEKAKFLQALALESMSSTAYTSSKREYKHTRSLPLRSHSHSLDFASFGTPRSVVPERYWEEKWRDLHKPEEIKQGTSGKQTPPRRMGWKEKVKQRLSRTESDPSQAKDKNGRKNQKSVRRRLLEDLSRALGSSEDSEEILSHEDTRENEHDDGVSRDSDCTTEERCLSGNDGSEENSSMFSDPVSPLSGANEHENDSEKSSVASNLPPDESDSHIEGTIKEPPLPLSSAPVVLVSKPNSNNDATEKLASGSKERKPFSDKFQWIWKFRRSAAGGGTAEKGECASPEKVECASEVATSSNNEGSLQNAPGPSTAIASSDSSSWRSDPIDQNADTVRNIGRSMLPHIQVIESVFQQIQGQMGSLEKFSKNVVNNKGQVTAMAALKELQKISNILSDM